ncbi:zinc ribbon domain-containing protein [Actinomadura rudentiformis]|uniref:Transposase n=1 Tax=Actinomadura rudentiformis TaxID=359158 RepID=A0A6H9Y8V9_9ACTN|nr:transposase [Actinomadura rudentiformis]
MAARRAAPCSPLKAEVRRRSRSPNTCIGESASCQRAGVPVIEVDAHHTSQMCPRCDHTTKSNRPTCDHFQCRHCGLAGPADHIAAMNVHDRAGTGWVFVNTPVPHRVLTPLRAGRYDPSPTHRQVSLFRFDGHHGTV